MNQLPNYGPTTQPNYGQTAQPNYGQPTQPNYGQTAQPNYGQPTQPNYGQPTQPNYGQTAQPNYGQTAQPNYGQTAQPNYGQTAQPNYGQPPQNLPAGNILRGHIYSPPTNRNGQDRPDWNALRVKQISVTLLILCAVNVILGSVAISIESRLAVVGAPIWGSVFFSITGILGVCAGSSKSTCTIVSTMVMSIISFVLWFNVIGLVAATLGLDVGEGGDETKITVDSFVLIATVVQGGIMLALPIYCCKAVCCCRNNSQNVVYFIPAGAPSRGTPGNPSLQQVVFYPPATQGYPNVPQPYGNPGGAGIPGYTGSVDPYSIPTGPPYPDNPPPPYSAAK